MKYIAMLVIAVGSFGLGMQAQYHETRRALAAFDTLQGAFDRLHESHEQAVAATESCLESADRLYFMATGHERPGRRAK